MCTICFALCYFLRRSPRPHTQLVCTLRSPLASAHPLPTTKPCAIYHLTHPAMCMEPSRTPAKHSPCNASPPTFTRATTNHQPTTTRIAKRKNRHCGHLVHLCLRIASSESDLYRVSQNDQIRAGCWVQAETARGPNPEAFLNMVIFN